jgi:hypothetical protein
MAWTYGLLLPSQELDAEGHIVGPTTDPANWNVWPIAMIPIALLGMILATRVWNAKPKPKPNASPASAEDDVASEDNDANDDGSNGGEATDDEESSTDDDKK